MATVEISDVRKKFGNTVALDGVDLSIRDGEFFVVLGPSGAGKTTTLKSVAGLEEIDAGTVALDGVDMAGVEPYRRNVAMAFESYALYPQDTVFENLASPLRSRRFGSFSDAQQKERIEAVTATLGIDHLLRRFPRELSNGQRQRVALGRVLVRPAEVYLLDEPLSHLDAKLRAAMRAELKSLGEMAKTTTLYVTHDYQEALALGDRIAVLRGGRVVQIGTPMQVWREPVDTFVARALGQPEMNLLAAEVVDSELVACSGLLRIPAPARLDVVAGNRVLLGVRPRDIELGTGSGGLEVVGTVRLAETLGRLVELSVDVGGTDVIAVVGSEAAPAEGDQVTLRLPVESMLVFDDETQALIGSLAAQASVAD